MSTSAGRGIEVVVTRPVEVLSPCSCTSAERLRAPGPPREMPCAGWLHGVTTPGYCGPCGGRLPNVAAGGMARRVQPYSSGTRNRSVRAGGSRRSTRSWPRHRPLGRPGALRPGTRSSGGPLVLRARRVSWAGGCGRVFSQVRAGRARPCVVSARLTPRRAGAGFAGFAGFVYSRSPWAP